MSYGGGHRASFSFLLFSPINEGELSS